MSKPITINQLKKLCNEEIAKGHGDYAIMISNDDEGNGFHYLWYSFATLQEMKDESYFDYHDLLYDMDKNVAPLDKTIILG